MSIHRRADTIGRDEARARQHASAPPLLMPIRVGRKHLTRTFDTVSSRMLTIILLSSLPLAVICGLVFWNNYEVASGLGAARAVAAITALRAQAEQESRRAATFAQDISTFDDLDDPAECARILRVVMRTQKPRYAALSVRGRNDAALCSVGATTFPSRHGQIGNEANDPFRVVARKQGPDGTTSLVAWLNWPAEAGHDHRLIAELPLGWPRRVLFGLNDDAGLLVGKKPVQAWLIGPDAATASACQDCRWPVPANFEQLRALAQAGGGRAVQVGDQQAAFGHLAGSVEILAVASPTRLEQRALSVLIIRVIGIVGLLGLGLVGVSLGANMLVVTPLRLLTQTVTRWREAGDFDPHESRLMPLELRGLSHAFTQATRSLALHEATLREAEIKQELLIKEIHHRVKNNLQIIASLLNLQANRIILPEAKAEFASARDRVRALATLHRYLYAEGDLQTVNMRLFLQELCGQLFQAIGEKQGRRIRLEIEAPEIAMSTDQSVPMALLVTEAVSNAIKYAFPDGRQGYVRVCLTALDDAPGRVGEAVAPGMGRLVIEDNGVGIPAGRAETDTGIRDGLGMQLIRGFARQLGASLDVQEGGCKEQEGTRYSLVFPLHPKQAELEPQDDAPAES